MLRAVFAATLPPSSWQVLVLLQDDKAPSSDSSAVHGGAAVCVNFFRSSFHSFNFVSRVCDAGSGCVVARGQNGFLYRVGFWGPSRWSSAVRSLWAALVCPIFVHL